MSLHTQWALGLCSNCLFPSRASLDTVKLGRPDVADMELAEPVSQFVSLKLNVQLAADHIMQYVQ